MRKYLSFYESLSQVWLSDIVMAMAILMVKIHLFTRALLASIASIEKATIRSCLKLNQMLDLVLNTLYQVNILTQRAIEYAMDSTCQVLKVVLSLSIAAVKGIILLLIDLYLGTLACLCTAFVHGTLEFVTDVVKDITEAVDDAINLAMKGINTALNLLSTVINGFLGTLATIKSIFTQDDTSSISDALDLVSLNITKLHNISIPTSFVDSIANLSNSIPDFEDVLSNLTKIVTTPLDVLNDHVELLSVTQPFDLSVPANQTYDVLGNTCLKLEESFQRAMSLTQTCSNYVLIGLGIAMFLGLCISIWISHRKWERNAVLLELLACENKQVEVGNLIFQYNNRMMYPIIKNFDPRLQWLVYYMNMSVVRRCLLIGACGVLAFGLQTMLLNFIEKNMPSFTESSTIDATREALKELVTKFVNETQLYVNETQDSINTELFDPIQQFTKDIYNTILDAETAVNNTVNTVFGSTPFASPLRTIIYCTIGRKLDSIESGLAWLISYSHLNLTSFADTNIDLVSEPSLHSVYALVSDFAEDNTIEYLIKQYRHILKVELLTASVFFGVWIVTLAIGCGILVFRELTEPDIQPQAIGFPRQLSQTQREQLGYPFHDPFVLTAASSRYTNI